MAQKWLKTPRKWLRSPELLPCVMKLGVRSCRWKPLGGADSFEDAIEEPTMDAALLTVKKT